MPVKCVPKEAWWIRGEIEVEILGTGHYPTTVMVRTKDGQEIEVELEDLKW